jgi:hypothetical protein
LLIICHIVFCRLKHSLDSEHIRVLVTAYDIHNVPSAARVDLAPVLAACLRTTLRLEFVAPAQTSPLHRALDVLFTASPTVSSAA